MTLTAAPSLVQQAVALGLLPPTADGSGGDDAPPRPWPVTLLTALGAWLAAVPLLLFAGLLLGSLFTRGVGPYLVGAAATVAAVMWLRNGTRSAFLEQLAVPGLLVGLGALGFGFGRDTPPAAAAFVMALCALGCSAAIRQGWLRILLGAGAAVLLAIALAIALAMAARPRGEWTDLARMVSPIWAAWQVLGAVGLASLWAQHRVARADQALWLEQVGTGWLLAVTAALAWLSGMTFLAGAALGGSGGGAVGAVGELSLRSAAASQPVQAALSALCAGAAAGVLARRWPALRRPSLIMLAAAGLGLSALMTSLGASLLIAAVCAASARRRRALAALLAAAWIVGAFYYAVPLPLATKALVLIGAGALVGAVAWAVRRTAPASAPQPMATAMAATGFAPLLPLAALAVVVISSGAVWQKEQLLANGRPAFVELAPVDPRSLMQGDYMTLAWRMPTEMRQELDRLQTRERPLVAARRDERQVLTLTHLVDAVRPLAAGEEIVELSPKSGRWVIVTDAWFFREGEAQRWQGAKYGEFRLLPDGRALLVGLRGPDLQPL